MPDSKPTFCTQCGAALTPGNAFCDQCGQRIGAAAPPSAQPSAPPPAVAAAAPATSKQNPSTVILLVVFVIVAAVVGIGGAMLWEKFKTSVPGAAATLPSSVPASDKPTILADPVGAFDDNGTPPVEVAYIHFLDEAHRLTNGNIRVGSPKSTPTRIEVRVTAPNGKPETVVVLEKSNDGRQATVIVGPKDAGAVRSYTLVLGPGGWTIHSFQDLEG